MCQYTQHSERRALVLEHAQALYGSQYPANHTWSVITTRTPDGKAKGKLTSHVIVYTQPGSMQSWRVLMSGEKSGFGEISAMNKLLDALMGELERVIEDGVDMEKM